MRLADIAEPMMPRQMMPIRSFGRAPAIPSFNGSSIIGEMARPQVDTRYTQASNWRAMVLRADVFRPAQPGRYAVILSYGPHAKGLAFQEGYPSAWQRMIAKQGNGGAAIELQERVARLRAVPARRSTGPTRGYFWRPEHAARRFGPPVLHLGSIGSIQIPIGGRRFGVMAMKLYGFWRSLATYRVRVALALKHIEVEQISINLLQGMQHSDDYKAVNPQSVVPVLAIDNGPPSLQ